ncbi:helix-turn-helix domain-containing protein [Myxococcus landrumensis]|uniref:Helix-turn-helix domain-containing protein n=1 Tax=Myxococcus landrumensis TaxID=2813577 RepID=A0ABX7N8Y4_9BACT|nr:helix-turn-helix domain-containing protein [Myxococcus landrumus]QSQ15222.1 helix-turn-helix domain-containing protein [Myxococcus landrumus]
MKPFAQQTYYELLEVPVTAQMEEIRAAYARLMELYAPDSIAVYALVESDQVDALRARMTEAMEILTDSDLRVEYDKDLGIAPPSAPSPAARAAEALVSAVESSAASTKEEKKAAEAPALTGPEAFRASFVSGYSLSYVTSSLQVAPLGGGLVDVPAALVRPEAPPAQLVEAPREPAPVAVKSAEVPPVESIAASDAATAGKGSEPLPTEAPDAVGASANPTETVAASAADPVSNQVPETPRPTETVAASAAAPVSSQVPETPKPTEAVAASAAAPVSNQVPEIPKPTEAVVASAAAPMPSQAPETPKPTEVAPTSAAPLSPVIESSAAPVVSEAPKPSAAASTSSSSAARGPAPTEPSTSIVVASTPERGASASAQARSGEAGISSSEAAATGQVAARTRDVRPRLPDIPSDAEFNGELLRRVREARGYTLHQVADRTRISSRHLENVEADRYTALPAQVYLRGILMNLARELGLDPLRVSKSYLALASEKSGKR